MEEPKRSLRAESEFDRQWRIQPIIGVAQIGMRLGLARSFIDCEYA
jgi:hypothetical protein